MVTMARRVTFSASKIDWVAELSQDENRNIFGDSASPEPYGHNYILEVGVKGEISSKTGIIINIKELDAILRRAVLNKTHRRLLNKIEPLCNQPVSCENLLGWIVQEVTEHLPTSVQPVYFRLSKTPLDCVEWRASKLETKARVPMLLTRVYEFAASHRLHSPHLSDEENRELFGKCNYPNGHGHNYLLEVTVTAPINPKDGRVMPAEMLDAIVHREVVDRYDHRHFNYDIPEFKDLIPSTEVVTKMIWERLVAHIPEPARLYRIVVRETERNIFEYSGEDSQ